MKILAFSDWRAQPIADAIELARMAAEPVDVIAYAGDDLTRFEESGKNYFSELARCCKAGVVLAVAGNDEGPGDKTVLAKAGVWDLYEEPFVYGDRAFIGVEGSTRGPGFLQHSEQEVEQCLKALRKMARRKKIIVVSHPPPYGVLDEGMRFAGPDEKSRHTGSTALRDFVKADRGVRLVICGHCHSRGGASTKLGPALVVNVASHDSPGSEGRMAVVGVDSRGFPDPEIGWLSTEFLLPPDSLRHVYGVGVAREGALRRGGVKTFPELARWEDLGVLSRASGLGPDFLTTLQVRAKALLDKRIIPIAPFNLKLVGPMFFDIETDIGGGRVWLIGTLWKGVFRQFFSEDWEGEATMLRQFLEFLAADPPPEMVSYSCTAFDKRVLVSAMERCGLDARCFDRITHVDLGKELRKRLALPTSNFAVKDVGEYFGYSFKHTELGGLQVAVEYAKHLREGKPLDQRVLRYNEDDVRVIGHILRKTSQLHGEARVAAA